VKLLLKILLSLLVGGICVALSLRGIDIKKTKHVLGEMSISVILLYALTILPVHFFRAWRWKYLLRPIGVSLSFGRLMLISTIGFMAILALPFRLGEFARPYYVVLEGKSRMSAILGTVAVERIVDGLIIAILLFVTYLFSLAPGAHTYSSVLAVSAWLALFGFMGLTAFLACALRWPDATIRITLSITRLRKISPRLADKLADKLFAMIQGFKALQNARDMGPFLLQTLLYWFANGFGMWILARLMYMPLPMSGAFASMAFTGVVITLPNSPGLVGQFHYGVKEGLAAYLSPKLMESHGLAYAVACHGIQFIWYVGLGFLAMLIMGGAGGTLRTLVVDSKRAAEQGGE
jgi:glycosyltransferase 2 family protein